MKTTEERKGYPQVYFAGNNVDPHSLSSLISVLRAGGAQKADYTVMAIVISKSGSTIEPMSGYMILQQAMNDAAITLKTVAVTDVMKDRRQPCFMISPKNRVGLSFMFPMESVVGSVYSQKSDSSLAS